jgi:tRNA pseudouridine55 synthase
VRHLEIRSYHPPLAVLDVHCSKGTYIRSLARDIAAAAGSCGHLAALNRYGLGGFRSADALDPEKIFPQALRPLDRKTFSLLGIPTVLVSKETAAHMIQGKPLERLLERAEPSEVLKNPETRDAGVFSDTGNLVGLVEKKAGVWRYGYIYARL